MRFLRNELYCEISKYSKILIYGAGHYANLAYSLLENAGLRESIASFVVTKLNKDRDVNGISVKCIDELEISLKENSVVLIAVSDIYEDEIVRILERHHYIHIIKFTEYIIRDRDFYEMLSEQPDKQFAGSIIGEYEWNNIGSIDGFHNKIREIENYLIQRKGMDTSRNTVVYVSGNLNSRSAKIIGALVRKKYEVIVLEYECCNELVRDEIMSYDIKFFHCKDMAEVFYNALQYKPLIYYLEPDWGGCYTSEVMVKHKDLFGKIVFAAYDVLNDGYVQVSEQNKLMERYCLENADGIVWRWFSKEFLEKSKGFTYKGKSIQFLDYCKGSEVRKNNSADDKVKICFIQGGIYQFLDKTILANNGIYAEMARIDTILKKIGNVEDYVFHIFIGGCNDSDKQKLDGLEDKYFNFKVFYGMEYSEMILKISEYDYGCFFVTNGKKIPILDSIDNVYYGSIYCNSVTNRFFDYLDADIPIISTMSSKLCEYLEQYEVIIKMDLSNLNINYLKENKIFYKKRAEKAKAELLIDNHIQRLIDWFNEL